MDNKNRDGVLGPPPIDDSEVSFKNINHLDISFKEFMPGQIIQSGQFNDDMNDIEEKVNEICDEHNTVAYKLKEHLTYTNNPHKVTAHQTGTYTSREIDEFVQDVKNGNLYDNAITNRVLDDDSVDNRNIIDGSITNSKLDSSIGSQIDISQNISITDRYTKEETDLLIQEKVGDGTYDKETIDEKLEQIQAGQILDKSIGIHQIKDSVGTKLNISNNPDILNKYTREEVDLLIQNNALPRDWGSILEEDDDTPVEIPTRERTLPVANHMKVDTFTVTDSSILDIDIQENVDARGEYNTIGERLDSVDSQIKEKANKDEVFTMANMGQDIKEAMVGGSVAVVGVNAVDSINIKSNAIEPRNIKGHSIINLLNSEESVVGYMGENGTVDTTNTSYRVSPYIQVNNGDTISFSGKCQQWKVQLVMFDSNFNKIEAKTFVDENGNASTWGTLSPFTITNANCAYIRFNYSGAIEQPYCYLSSSVPSKFVPYNEVSLDWLKITYEDNGIPLEKLNLKIENQLYLTDSIKYKTDTSHLYLPDLLYVVNGVFKTIKATDFPDKHPTGEFRFWANNLSTLYFDSKEASKGNYPFIWKTLAETVEQVGSRYQTIAIVKDRGIISNYTVEYIDNINSEDLFDVTKTRLMIPNKLFLVEDVTLPIYKNSIINNIEEGRKVTVMFKSDKSYSDGYYEYIEPKININPAKVGIDGFIGIVPDVVTWENGFYGKNITIKTKKKTEITNTNPNILFFGDSLTAKGTPAKTKDFLTSWGVNANMLGTVNDDYNVPCEGRGSRTFAQYIGYRSLETTDDTTPTPVYPFLKVATSEDKANHPTWCFTRTGSVKEQNYTEATDKSQDFYIFDFTHYLTSQGYSNPDVVIISMSTNDFWKYDESEATSICKLAYEIMINQILTACPNCKIGIIPTPAYASTKGDKEIVSKWNTVAQDYIYDMNNSNVDIVGAWLSQSSDMSFNLAENIQVAEGGISSYRQPDTIHPTPWGIKETSKSIACYIANQL